MVNSRNIIDEKGELHREDGPTIETENEDGPALEWQDGFKEWFLNGFLHCDDGPAIEGANGYKEWWLEGKRLPPYVQTVEQLKSYIRNKILW